MTEYKAVEIHSSYLIKNDKRDAYILHLGIDGSISSKDPISKEQVFAVFSDVIDFIRKGNSLIYGIGELPVSFGFIDNKSVAPKKAKLVTKKNYDLILKHIEKS